LNALIPRDVRVPEGSGDRGSSLASRQVEPRRARSKEAAYDWGKPAKAGEFQADRAGKRAGRSRSSRSGSSTPEWRPLRGGSRCGRGKGRYERPAPLGGEAAKCREALILGKRNRPKGSETARLSALLNAMLSTVRADLKKQISKNM
jgi:hypothetical protein